MDEEEKEMEEMTAEDNTQVLHASVPPPCILGVFLLVTPH